MKPNTSASCVIVVSFLLGSAAFGAQGAAVFPQEFRSIDGTGNNLAQPDLGAAGTPLLRRVANAYTDGISAPPTAGRPSARTASNVVASQSGAIHNERGASDFVWVWGQFLDHDIDLSPEASPHEGLDIRVPNGDPFFDPAGTGSVVIPMGRSQWDLVAGVREQVNVITAFVDGSNVYGSDPVRAAELRTLDGTGRLKTSAGDLLPFNTAGLPNAPSDDPSFFLAGDERANEQSLLIAMHTLFVREHNTWAGALAARGVTGGDQIYQIARAIVGAELQAITYNEFLPVLLGDNAIGAYQGYQESVDPRIANVFSTAAFRVGHTMLSSTLLRLEADGSVHSAGNLALADAFFDPDTITDFGVEPYIRGATQQLAQRVDPFVIDDIRNFLFGLPGSGGFDLASLNIQRGRDHGLASYNGIRAVFGIGPAASMDEITSDPTILARLKEAYRDVDDIDAWVGLLAEGPTPTGMVGPTLRAVLADQFARLRDGDRFWYEAYLPASLVGVVQNQTLAAIIRRNTDAGLEIQDDVFRMP